MSRKTYGAQEARAHLPEILERAHHGEATIVTKRGRAYAAIVPVQRAGTGKNGASLLRLRGTGRGCWGKQPAAAIARLRDEWR